jgi:hypothetical protein
MPEIIVLFGLKDDADREEYERWAREVDAPTVTSLPSVDDFAVYRVSGLLGSDASAPHDYCEVIRVNEMRRFFEDIATPRMREVAATFQGSYADAPSFLVCDRLV